MQLTKALTLLLSAASLKKPLNGKRSNILLGSVKFFALFQVNRRTAADNQRGDDAGQGLTGGRFAVGIGIVDLEYIKFVSTIGTLIAAAQIEVAV